MNIGALRAAALWRHLQLHGSIQNRDFRRIFNELLAGDEGEVPDTPDGLNHARERAIADLEALGIPVRRTQSGIELGEFADPETDAFLEISPKDRAFIDSVHRELQDLDPATVAAEDHLVFMKHHLSDLIEITYGGSEYQGVLRRISTRNLPRHVLVIQNRNGLMGFYVDAIADVRVIQTRQEMTRIDGADPLPIEADAVNRPPRIVRGRGRPSDSTKLRLAQKARTAIRSITRDDGKCSWELLEAATGESRSKLASLSNVIAMVDREIVLGEDGYEIVHYLNRSGKQFLNGGDALVAILEISAAIALGTGFKELLPSFTIGEAVDLVTRLETFLSRIDLETSTDTPAFGAELVAASLGHYPIEIETTTSNGLKTLKDIGLRWHQSQWWVLGEVDGKPLAVSELRLLDISRTE